MNKSVKHYIFKGNKINFILLLFASLCEAAAMIIISLMLEKIISIATAKDLDALLFQGMVFLILLGSCIILFLLNMYIKPKYKKKAITQYKNNIYDNLLKKSITNFNKENTSTYISALTNDVNYIEENYIFSIFEIITQAVLFISTIVIMIIFSPILSLFAIISSLIPFVACILVGAKLPKHEKRISDQNASFMHFVKDNLIGFSTIKVFKSEDKIKELFENNNDILEEKKRGKTKTIALLDMVQTITMLIPQFGVFFIGAYLAIKTGSFGPSVIILFVQLMNYIMSPLMKIPDLFSKRRACNPLFKKIDDILNNSNDENINRVDISSIDSIEIKNLSFSYDDKKIINDLSYKLEKNKSYAIVGTSGSGKTTLLNLLSGRNSNYDGDIIYNDVKLKDISLDSLYEISSFVEQNVFVFDDSIINNITMYSKVDDVLLEDVINKSGLSKLIDEKGKDYKCGENGCNLSGGEKQRISIARALIKKSKLIMLDEATSALDNETSTSITNNILDIKDTTKIMITHRLDEKLLKRFDEILVVKNGKIVESGKYDTLINNNYVFKSLVEISTI